MREPSTIKQQSNLTVRDKFFKMIFTWCCVGHFTLFLVLIAISLLLGDDAPLKRRPEQDKECIDLLSK